MMRSTAYPNNPSSNYHPDTPNNMVHSHSADEIPISAGDGVMVTAFDPKDNERHMETPALVECAPPTNSTIAYPSNGTVPVANAQYVFLDTRKPVTLTFCPHCAQQHVATRTHNKVTGTTWVCVAAGVVIFWPLCWLPFVIKPMKQTNHYCSSCGVKVGRVKPFQ